MGKILVACEESQAVTIELRLLGLEAYSCDTEPCSGGRPEWHIQENVICLLNKQWDMILAFPPCTHLACSGARWFKQKQADGRQQQGIDFFMEFTKLDCPKISIENPIGIMSTYYRKPDQIIQPYEYGTPARKSTCLWLKGLPKLQPTDTVDKGEYVQYASGKAMSKWYADSWNLPPKERGAVRSKTLLGIAKAMASQWGILT